VGTDPTEQFPQISAIYRTISTDADFIIQIDIDEKRASWVEWIAPFEGLTEKLENVGLELSALMHDA
jgi:hypothetical protein